MDVCHDIYEGTTFCHFGYTSCFFFHGVVEVSHENYFVVRIGGKGIYQCFKVLTEGFPGAWVGIPFLA